MPTEQVMQIEETNNWFIDRIGDMNRNYNTIIYDFLTSSIRDREAIVDYFVNDVNSNYNSNYIINYDINSVIDTRDLSPTIPFVDHSAEVVVVADMEISEEEKDCCVCMEDRVKTDICRLNCAHTFCCGCVKKLMNKQDKCPLCRTGISKICVQTEENRMKFNKFE